MKKRNCNFTAVKSLLVAALVICMVLSSSGCSIILNVGRAVWHRVASSHSQTHLTATPDSTGSWYEENTPEPTSADSDETLIPEPTDADDTDSADPTETSQDNDVVNNNVTYIDIHDIHGTQNLKSYIPVTWQRGSSSFSQK